MRKLLGLIRVPLLLAFLWAVFGVVVEPEISTSVWLAVRILFVAAAGFLVTHNGRFGLLAAALAGAIVVFVDHVVVKGTAFVVTGEFQAAGGVVISYIMFVWVEMAIGVLGGIAGKTHGGWVRGRAGPT